MKRKALFFTASWCGPCQKVKSGYIAPLLNYLSDDESVEVIDVEQSYSLCKQYDVTRIPKLVLLQDDEVVYQTVGTDLPELQNLYNWLEGRRDDFN